MAGNEVRILVNATDKASKVFGNVKKSAGLMGAAVATAVVGIGVASVKMASSFDKGMREVNTLLQLPEAQFATLKDDLLDFSQEMGITANEVVPSLYQAISAGVPRDNVFEFLTVAGKASIGGVTSLEVAVDGLTSVTNAYGVESLSASKAADIMFTAVRLGKTTMGELSASLFNIVPIAAATGIEFEQVAAAMAALTSQGVPTTVAATQLRAAIQALSAPTVRQRTLINELGLDFSATRLKQIGLSAAFKEAIEATGGNMEQLRRLIGSVEGLQAVLALGGEQSGKFEDALEAMEDAAGSVEDAFDQMEQTTSRKFEQMKTSIDLLMIKLGDSLLDNVNTTLDAVNRSLEENADEWEKWGNRAAESIKFVGGLIAFNAKAIDQLVSDIGTVLTAPFDFTGKISGQLGGLLGGGPSGPGPGATFNLADELGFADASALREWKTAVGNVDRAISRFVTGLSREAPEIDLVTAAFGELDDMMAALARETAAAADELAQAAIAETVARQTAEVAEAFLRGGEQAVEAVRGQQAALDDEWAGIVGGLAALGVEVPEEMREMFDGIRREQTSAAASMVAEERRKQDAILAEQKRASDRQIEEQRRLQQSLTAGAIDLFAAAVGGNRSGGTGALAAQAGINPQFLDTLLNQVNAGASNEELTGLLQAVVAGLTVNVQIGDEELNDVVISAVTDAQRTGALS